MTKEKTNLEKSTWKLFKETILTDKLLIIGSILIAVLAYGFAVTNFSIGVDDPGAFHYLYSDGWGSMIQQGRLLHIVLNWITGLVEFVPFLNDFLGAALFWASSLAFCFLFQYISNFRFSSMACLTFAGLYISFPIINEKFIYNLDVVAFMLSYLCIALSAYTGYRAIFQKEKRQLILAFFFCVIGISSYESFVTLFVCVVLSIFVIKAFTDAEQKMKWKEVFVRGLLMAAILAVACAFYYTIVFIVQVATDQADFVRSSVWAQGLGLFTVFESFFTGTLPNMLNFSSVSMAVFWTASAIGAVMSIWYGFVKKTWIIPLCYLGMFVSNFLIHISVGYYMLRAAQTCCFFVGVVGLLTVTFAEKFNVTKRIAYVLACLLILIQVQDLNKWFYNDYSRYQKEAYAVHSIATELRKYYDVSKPVVFTGKPDYYGTYFASPAKNSQVNGSSVLRWGVRTFGEVQSKAMIELFKMHGYYFLKPTTIEQSLEAIKHSKTMPPWPEEGAIREYNDYIIVNIGPEPVQ